jgi:hypothetical protein
MGLARSTYYDEPEIQPIDEARLVEQIMAGRPKSEHLYAPKLRQDTRSPAPPAAARRLDHQ